MSHDRHVFSTHPLKMGFTKYLGTMDESALAARLGQERAEAFRSGELDTSHFLSPPSGEKYGVAQLREDDIASFTLKTE